MEKHRKRLIINHPYIGASVIAVSMVILLRSSIMDEIKETWRDKWSEDELHD